MCVQSPRAFTGIGKVGPDIKSSRYVCRAFEFEDAERIRHSSTNTLFGIPTGYVCTFGLASRLVVMICQGSMNSQSRQLKLRLTVASLSGDERMKGFNLPHCGTRKKGTVMHSDSGGSWIMEVEGGGCPLVSRGANSCVDICGSDSF